MLSDLVRVRSLTDSSSPAALPDLDKPGLTAGITQLRAHPRHPFYPAGSEYTSGFFPPERGRIRI